MARVTPRRTHLQRFDSWCALGGKPLLDLAKLVKARLTTPFTENGFEWAEREWKDPIEQVSGREISLVRRTADETEEVKFIFDKYRRPAFQIFLSRRKSLPPHQWIRGAKLVRRSRQYYYFWGKPGWLPTRFWTRGMSERTVYVVIRHLPQAFSFLEHGDRGPNMNRNDLPFEIIRPGGPAAN